MLLLRLIAGLLALALIAVGVLAMIAPTPLGFVVVIAGLVLLAWSVPAALHWLRRRWPLLDRRLDRLTARGPRWLARILINSDPR